jgi:hypothetical protein
MGNQWRQKLTCPTSCTQLGAGGRVRLCTVILYPNPTAPLTPLCPLGRREGKPVAAKAHLPHVLHAARAAQQRELGRRALGRVLLLQATGAVFCRYRSILSVYLF